MEAERNALRLSPDEWIEAILADPRDELWRRIAARNAALETPPSS